MRITSVNVRKMFDTDPLRAVVSITIDDELAIHDIKVIHARDSYFVTMPSRMAKDGSRHDIAHPINTKFRGCIEKAILDEYNAQLAANKEEI